MQAIILDEDLAATVASVAKQLKTSHQAVIKKAIDDYVEKIKRHPSVLSFAGILEESEANDLLDNIQQTQLTKNSDYAFLNDDVWRGEAMSKDLADNHDLYLYDE